MKDIDILTGEVKDLKEEVASFRYDPEKDLHPVDPMGYINLRDAYENHNVPTNIADDVANYNGIEDPESILGTPKDIFEAYRMRDSVNKIEAAKAGVSSSKDEN